MQQRSVNLNIGLYVATFAEFLSDQINMPQDGFLLEYLCNRYATLLWRYDIDKANDGYISENDDSPKLMGQSTPPLEEDLIYVFDYENIDWAKHRSKKLHNPFVMTKANIEKLKKDVPSSLKEEVVKTPQKEGQNFAPAISRPSFTSICFRYTISSFNKYMIQTFCSMFNEYHIHYI
ncbi:hypothetical protein H5410_008000 [Solanum commersonii]|uniref:Uncharacterized protein n=1 Tax=Solanum commersonii TaxID=4109 RepID=A0A9J6ADN3_SOLCO|nr:hypothetical protein H5410_008000 [Solanum commersonii]